MNLIIDEGNTAFKLALYEDKTLVKSRAFKPIERQEMHSWISDSITTIQHVIVSSVVNDGLDLSRYTLNELVLDHSTPLPIQNNYQSPETLGKDRIANAVGGWIKNPKGNTLVIDLGTCIKYDIISSAGIYSGGIISAGIKMKYKAIHKFTANLPLLDSIGVVSDVGTDTESSIRSGVEQGIYHEINGFIKQFSSAYSELTIFMTGGDAKFFDKPFIVDIFADPNLTLFGLNEILKYNVENN
jgi:type III pantothenate kinase